MDTVTHTLFGLTLYGALNKSGASPAMKKSLLFTALAGSQIPDIDFVTRFTETGHIMHQMWHRGITHSVFMIPVWALLIWYICRWIWKIRERRVMWLGVLAVFIHDLSDMLNAWGTGFFEPASSFRVSIGAIPIVDVVYMLAMLLGWFLAWYVKKIPSHYMLRAAWGIMALYSLLQVSQVVTIHNAVADRYERIAVSAGFVPGQFQVFGKNPGLVDIMDATAWRTPVLRETLASDDNANLRPLFDRNPRAWTLYVWAPFVVVVNNDKELGIYDPRFYRNGQSFLHESIVK
ncbi:metal-dependent hydrolase [Paenibacillus hamazuiensis]|uniref:metal-dependent hydrolase n=1 Tax=Paenibacillus hamazuiensis TaxID=2936508 RepID=UPI00200DA68A|nr:metal-dependent hydrolase [Paenibacillus hamazuiensis]